MSQEPIFHYELEYLVRVPSEMFSHVPTEEKMKPVIFKQEEKQRQKINK